MPCCLRRPETVPQAFHYLQHVALVQRLEYQVLEHALTSSWLQEISVFAKKQHSQKKEGKNRHKRAHHLDPIGQHVVA